MSGVMGKAGTILHLDMDAFYAAVEVLDFPELAGKPVIVGSPPDRRGVVSTASYEARAFGVRSAMPSRTAGKLCPQGVFRPVRMDRYAEVSRQVMAIVESFTPIVEQVSVDEAFLDVSGVMRRWTDSVELARSLKREIRAKTGLTCSVGVAPNKFLAKLSSDLKKPDGLCVAPTEPAAIAGFLAPLPVSRIWGVGKVTEEHLRGFGIRLIADVQRLAPSALASMVGEHLAAHIGELAFGRDARAVETETEAKSLSSETTFDEDCEDAAVVRQVLIEQAEHVGWRLRRHGFRARQGHLKIRYGDFSMLTRQMPLARPTHANQPLVRCALALLDRVPRDRAVRLIGFGASGFAEEDSGQLWLGDVFERDPGDAKLERLDEAVDLVRGKFGDSALRRASTLRPRGEHGGG